MFRENVAVLEQLEDILHVCSPDTIISFRESHIRVLMPSGANGLQSWSAASSLQYHFQVRHRENIFYCYVIYMYMYDYTSLQLDVIE